nr:vigilin-like [Cherax quadricarinatus]
MATRQSMEKAMHHTQQITEQRCHRVSSQQSSTNTPAFWDPQDKLRQALTVKCAKASKVVKAYVEAPTWSHKFVIGCKGVNIRQITQDHPKVHVEFQGQQGSIKLEGPPEEVVAAIEKLEFMIAELQRKLCFDQITVNPMLCKHIIGRNGSNISRIRNDTGVSFNITEVGHRSLIHFEGSPDGVSRARKDLEELVAKFEKETERRIIIDRRFHGVFIGTKGVKIKEIRDKFNVRISFPNPGKHHIINVCFK